MINDSVIKVNLINISVKMVNASLRLIFDFQTGILEVIIKSNQDDSIFE